MAKFCDDQKQHTDQPRWFDPMGPNRAGQHAPTGGPEMRDALFNRITGLSDQFADDSSQFAAGLKTAAADPGWSTVQGNARANAMGQYLTGGPYLTNILRQFSNSQSSNLNPTYNRTVSGGFTNQAIPGGVDKLVGAMRQRGSAEAADTGANIRSSFGRAGLGFGTANQQAEQSNRAAATARADENEAAIRNAERQLQAQNYMQERAYQNQAGMDAQNATRDDNRFSTSAQLGNYQTERARQTGAGEQLASAFNPMLQYLSQAPAAFLSPISQIANVVQGLAGGGPIATPQTQVYTEKGYGNDILSGIGTVAGGAAGGF